MAELNEKFVAMLDVTEDELNEKTNSEERKDLEIEEPKKSKRGRPKKEVDDEDNSGKEGVRDITLTAKIKIGKETKTETKELKDFDMNKKVKLDGVEKDALDVEIKKWEKALYKKTNYDADNIIITKVIGGHEVEDKAEQHMTKNDDGDHPSDSEYSFGRKDK